MHDDSLREAEDEANEDRFSVHNLRYASLCDRRDLFTLHYPHSTPAAFMPKSCCSCNSLESQDNLFAYCASTCKSAMYCSKACQRKDWEKQHKKICKLLNVGHGGMQIQTEVHLSRSICTKKAFEREELKVDETGKRFFKLFQESTFEGSQAAALEMKTIAERQTKETQKFLLFQSLYSLPPLAPRSTSAPDLLDR
jgi:hypothetical protein